MFLCNFAQRTEKKSLMKNFITRTLTGFAYVIIIIAGIFVNQYTFLALFSVVVIACMWEFYGLLNKCQQLNISRITNCLGGVVLFASTYLYASGKVTHAVFLPYLCYIVFMLVFELYRKKGNPIHHLSIAFLGQCYIALPLSLLNMIAFAEYQEGAIRYYPLLILSLFAFIWVNDTGAYLTGMSFGKHRLFERISPKKSWEGFFGGLIFTVLSAFVFAHFETNIPYYHWIGLAIAVVVFGTWGDLIESLIKRTLGVKDSGRSLPGHGGFLDRFDSLLLAVYGMLFYIELFKIKC